MNYEEFTAPRKAANIQQDKVLRAHRGKMRYRIRICLDPWNLPADLVAQFPAAVLEAFVEARNVAKAGEEIPWNDLHTPILQAYLDRVRCPATEDRIARIRSDAGVRFFEAFIRRFTGRPRIRMFLLGIDMADLRMSRGRTDIWDVFSAVRRLQQELNIQHPLVAMAMDHLISREE